MRDAALQRDWFILGAAGLLARAARITSFAMLDHLGGSFKRADLADPGDRVCAAFPEDAALEVLVGTEAMGIDRELSHGSLLRLTLASHLLDLDHHELGRLERRKADQDVDDAEINV